MSYQLFETDHENQLLSAIPSMILREMPWLRAVLVGVAGAFQCFDDELLDMLSSTTLATASDKALDRFGALIGVSRRGLSDDEFREVLVWRAQMRKSRGRRQDVLALQQLTGLTLDYAESYPAAVDLSITFDDSPPTGDGLIEHIAQGLLDAVALGVGVRAVESGDGFFQLDSTTNGLDAGLLTRRIV